MARTKNRDIVTELSFSKQAPVWHLGKYLRLSKDDFKRGNVDTCHHFRIGNG